MAAAVALAFADSSIVMLGLPEIYGELEATISEVALVITAYNLVVAVVALALVPVVGRVRPALPVGAGLVVFAAASLRLRPGERPGRADRPARRAGPRGRAAAVGVAPRDGRPDRLVGARPGVVGPRRQRSGPSSGPAAGGLLTQLFDWRAICLSRRRRSPRSPCCPSPRRAIRALAAEGGGTPRVRLWPNAGLVFAFGALVGRALPGGADDRDGLGARAPVGRPRREARCPWPAVAVRPLSEAGRGHRRRRGRGAPAGGRARRPRAPALRRDRLGRGGPRGLRRRLRPARSPADGRLGGGGARPLPPRRPPPWGRATSAWSPCC